MLKQDFNLNAVKLPRGIGEINLTELAKLFVAYPEPPKVGDILKVVGFKGEDIFNVRLSCLKGEEQKEVRIRTIVAGCKQTGITPNDVPCDPVIEEQYKDRLQYIYPLAVGISYGELFPMLDGQTIICCGSMETRAVYNEKETPLTIWKYAILFDEE